MIILQGETKASVIQIPVTAFKKIININFYYEYEYES